MVSRPRRIGIRDVADASGVSVTTVSHALNNKGRIDSLTRERVIAVADELGYRPDRNARSLASGRASSLGLLLPLDSEGSRRHVFDIDFYLELTIAAVEAAFDRDHAILPLPPVRSSRDLQRFSVDGGIIVDPAAHDPRIRLCEEVGLPWVTVGRDVTRAEESWWTAADAEASTRMVLDHLAAAGSERIALMSVDIGWSWFVDIFDAYHSWTMEHGREPVVVLAPPDKSPESAARATESLLDGHNRVDAVFAPPQWLATDLLRGARERSVRVPADMLVAVGVESGAARVSDPPLTAVDLDPRRTAATAVELLLDRVAGRHGSGPRVIPTTLRHRASTTTPGA